MDELKQTRISMSVHFVVAILMGWLSIEITAMSRSLFAILLGFVVLYFTGFIAQRLTGQKGIKWWLANGLVVYLFVWLITWIVLYNTALA